MRDHQRYYPVRKEDGSLMPYFLTVRNGGDRAIRNVQIGNERVLRARLDDAKFFFDGDRRKSLEGHREALSRINYQEGMGTMLDKSDRLVKLVEAIGEDWNFTDTEKADVRRAAYLSKSDLATGMVTEFTELQGEMGKEYALLDGEKPKVAAAIFEQYMPRFAGDVLPKSSIGRALSLSDKLDNLAATFLRGLIPTGSQDPFALRRQTIGAVHILTDGGDPLGCPQRCENGSCAPAGDTGRKKIRRRIKWRIFFRQRIKAILLDEGVDYDIVDAVLTGAVDDVYAIFLKAHSMMDSHVKGELEMRQAVTRLVNITKGKTAVEIRPELLTEEAEKNLYAALEKAGEEVTSAYNAYDYGSALPALKTLTVPINQFLDSVMVMVEEEAVRNNRISLLINVLEVYGRWGDFSKLV